MFKNFGNIVAGVMLLQNPAMLGVDGGSRYEKVKVKDLGHSATNLKEREKDGNDAEIKAQSAAFTRDILKGKKTGEVNPLNRHEINWLTNSVFIVEPGNSIDAGKKYAVLSGRHRLDWLLAQAQIDARWNDFEVLCEVARPSNDAERVKWIARGNADAAPGDTVIKPSNSKRFAAFYDAMPEPEYVFTRDSKGAIKPVEGSRTGWTSTEYQNETGIGGSHRVTYSAMTRLGRHFGIPVDVFTEARVAIKPQISPALYVKDWDAGETEPASTKNKVTGHLPKGLEVRYRFARLNAKTPKEMEEVKQAYKREFLALLDVKTDEKGNIATKPDGTIDAGEGEHANGNEPALSDAEKTEREKREKAEAATALQKGQRDLISSRCVYTFEKRAVERFFDLPEKQGITPTLGNAFDLLSLLREERLAPAVTALGEWKADTSNNLKANAALQALTLALSGQTSDAKHMKQAANASPNTKKKAK